VFNDSGTIKNEAPAADPSVCAANGLVSNQKSLGGAVRREPSLAPFSLVLVWFLGLDERCGGWGWSHGGK
jgi:hypothetical protein